MGISGRRLQSDDGTAAGDGGKATQGSPSPGHPEAEDAVDELPPGWTKEVKLRKNGNRRKAPKRDTIYIDPERKYELSSLRDVFRYQETGNIKDCRKVRKIKADDVPSTEDDHVQSPESKEKSTGEDVREINFSEEKIMLNVNVEDADKQTSVPVTDTSEYVNNKACANITKQMDFLMSDNKNELMASEVVDPNCVEDGVPMTDANNAHVQTVVGTSDVVNLQQGKPDNAAISSGLHPDARAEKIDLSSAEAALTSLYGEFRRDLSIEFAVKLIMGEIPLPKEALEIEKFFSQKMKGKKKRKG